MRSVMSLAVSARDSRVTTTSLSPPVSSPVDVVGPQRLGDARDRHGAGLAEIRRAEHRHVGGGAGVLDEVADAHDFRR